MSTPKLPLVVVTGASSGIGLATARLFSSHGHPLLPVSYTHLTLPTILLV